MGMNQLIGNVVDFFKNPDSAISAGGESKKQLAFLLVFGGSLFAGVSLFLFNILFRFSRVNGVVTNFSSIFSNYGSLEEFVMELFLIFIIFLVLYLLFVGLSFIAAKVLGGLAILPHFYWLAMAYSSVMVIGSLVRMLLNWLEEFLLWTGILDWRNSGLLSGLIVMLTVPFLAMAFVIYSFKILKKVHGFSGAKAAVAVGFPTLIILWLVIAYTSILPLIFSAVTSLIGFK